MANSYFTRARAYLRRFLPVSSKQRFLIGLLGKKIYVESFPFLGDSDFREGTPGEYFVDDVIFSHDSSIQIGLFLGMDYRTHCYYDFDDPEFRFKVI